MPCGRPSVYTVLCVLYSLCVPQFLLTLSAAKTSSLRLAGLLNSPAAVEVGHTTMIMCPQYTHYTQPLSL